MFFGTFTAHYVILTLYLPIPTQPLPLPPSTSWLEQPQPQPCWKVGMAARAGTSESVVLRIALQEGLQAMAALRILCGEG